MERFPGLRAKTVLLKVLAGLVVLVGFWYGNELGQAGNGDVGFGVTVIFAVVAFLIWVFAELIGVLLAIEENTRRPSTQIDDRPTPSSYVPSSSSKRADKSAERPAWMG